MNSYELSRKWFDWCFENPELINPNHSAIYFFCIEHCNRLGWKDKFGFPSQMAMEAIGIKNWRTYNNSFNDLVNWGFIKLIEKSKNQYSSNVIAIVKNTKANTKALDKALQNHSQKQSKSIVSINKQETNKQITNNLESRRNEFRDSLAPFVEKYGKTMMNEFYCYWIEPNKSNTKMRFELQQTWSTELRLKKWASKDNNFNLAKPKNYNPRA
jgi:hypothetical protein